MSSRDGFTRVYIGRLPRDVTEREVEKLAREFGRIRDVRILTGFAFVEYDDPRDARDCVRELDGVRYDGERLQVQPARTEGERRRTDQLRRGQYALKITNLPPRTSWQDLKDLFRKVGDVVFTDVDHGSGDGTVEFSQESHKEDAIRQYDGYDMNGSRIMVQDASGGGGGGRGGSDDRRDDRYDDRRDDRGRGGSDDRNGRGGSRDRGGRGDDDRSEGRPSRHDDRDRSRSPRRD